MFRRVASWVAVLTAVVFVGGCLGGPQTDPPGLHDRSTGDAGVMAPASDAGPATDAATGLFGDSDAGGAPASDAGAPPPAASLDTEAPADRTGGITFRPRPPVRLLVPSTDAAATPDCCDDAH